MTASKPASGSRKRVPGRRPRPQWGECAGLRVGRLDFLRSTLQVAEQLTRGPRGLMVPGSPKSEAGQRTMAVPPALMALLSEHLAWRGIAGADPDQFAFPAPQGGHLDYAHWRRRVWKPATAAGPTRPAWCSTGSTENRPDPPRPQRFAAHLGGLRAGHDGGGRRCGRAARDAVHGNPAAC